MEAAQLTPIDNIPLSEIGAVMCAIADENVWSNGKRNYLIATRDYMGMVLTVRCKFGSTALVYNGWRIGFDGFYTHGDIVPERCAKIPAWTRKKEVSAIYNNRGQQVGKRTIQTVNTYLTNVCIRHVTPAIPDEARFLKDWALIRMFRDDWDRYVISPFSSR